MGKSMCDEQSSEKS